MKRLFGRYIMHLHKSV